MVRQANTFCEQQCPYLTSAEDQVNRVAAASDAMALYADAGFGLAYMWRSRRARHCDGPISMPPQPALDATVYCSHLGRALLRDGSPAHKKVDLSDQSAQHPHIRNPERWQELYQYCWNIEREAVAGRLTMLDNDMYPEAELAQAESLSLEELYRAYGRDNDGTLLGSETKDQAQEFQTVMYLRGALIERQTVADYTARLGMDYDAAIDAVVDSHAEAVKGYATELMARELGGQTL